MSQGTVDRVTFDAAAQTTLRVMIASYFLAVALNLIPGTDLALLFSGVLPDPYAGAVAAGLVFIFSFMIMIGMAMRLAALLIALMTFYASYLTLVDLGVHQELGAFWRDIALIAALLLTYSEPRNGARRGRRVLQRKIVPRRVHAILDRATLHDPMMPDFRTARKARLRLPDAEDRPSHHNAPTRSEATDLPRSVAQVPVQKPVQEPAPEQDVPVLTSRRVRQTEPAVQPVDVDDYNIFAGEALIA